MKIKKCYDTGFDDFIEKKKENIRMDVIEDRKEIERIIRINLPLMNKNKRICQDIADAILVYLIDKKEDKKMLGK